jgi:uracil-DNA glycosylase family 4
MTVKPDTCRGCVLYEKGEGFVNGEGSPYPDLFVIGEAAGANEASQGRPFCGGAGRILTALLSGGGVNRSNCYITNVVKCRPPGNHLAPYMPLAAQHCRQYLDRELSEHPKANIVLLGDTALHAILGKKSIMKHRGCVYEWGDRRVLATIHPAALMRDPKMWNIVVSDLSYARTMSRHQLPEQRFVIEPTLEQVIEWFQKFLKPGGTYFVDIETSGQALCCIGIAANESDAICIPFWRRDGSFYWDPAYALAITEMCNLFLAETEYFKVMQNGVFDTSVLEGFGFEINGWIADTMLMHHLVYSELKHSLAFLHSIYVRGNYYKDMFHAEKDEEEES